MVDEEGLLLEIDKGFDKNKSMLKDTMKKIDSVLTSASSNIMCYVFLFVIIALALLYKMT